MVAVACMGVHVLRHLKEWLAWATDKRLWVISNIKNSYTTKKLKDKAVSLNSIECIAMLSLVIYSNCLVI